jgi:thiol-disulfide isomerase/thioredoxin
VNRRAFVAISVLAAAAGAGVAWKSPRRRGVPDPAVDRLWAHRFERPEGGELSMASLRGRPLVINFWATWCPPCIKELPALDRFRREQPEGGWQVVALAIDGRTPVREFLAKVPVSIPVGLAGLTGTDLSRELGNAQGGLPFTVLISADARIVWRKTGETTLDELRREAARA